MPGESQERVHRNCRRQGDRSEQACSESGIGCPMGKCLLSVGAKRSAEVDPALERQIVLTM